VIEKEMVCWLLLVVLLVAFVLTFLFFFFHCSVVMVAIYYVVIIVSLPITLPVYHHPCTAYQQVLGGVLVVLRAR
jgi:hypothetical protein